MQKCLIYRQQTEQPRNAPRRNNDMFEVPVWYDNVHGAHTSDQTWTSDIPLLLEQSCVIREEIQTHLPL